MSRRVVITGIGIWSCLGTDIEVVKESLYNGRSGIVLDKTRVEYGFRSGLTGRVDKPVLKGLIDRRQRTNMPEQAEYAYMAASQAFQMAGIDKSYMDCNEIGCIFGNDSSAKSVVEGFSVMERHRDTELMGSGYVFQSMNSTVNMNLCSIFQLKGINFCVSAACASGSHSIGLGYLMIKQGLQDMVLCGGAQETNMYGMSSFDAIRTFSVRMDDPPKASRPFDKNRDGLVPSGGAAAIILEDYDHALARGANILCELCGYGFSGNGGAISQPNDIGCTTAIERAMKCAGIKPANIDYINAHATSTVQGDMIEAIALDRIFAGEHALISSTKSMTGHECWMAGASEIVYSVIMMQNDFVAPNINFEEPDEYSARLNIATRTVDTRLNYILSNSFGFGGTNSALIIGNVK